MRQDAGVDGDAQRISQIVWMVFLKMFDDKEKEYETLDPKYRSPIPERLRWRNWAANEEGITGEKLLDFVNNTLFKGLKNFPAGGDARGLIVRQVFEDAYNYMKSGTLIRQVVNKINQIDFNRKDERHLFNDIYEHMLKELQSAGNAGEYYTPRPITEFIVEMTKPKLGQKILDPACGTGGFLANAIEYIRGREVKSPKDEKKLQESLFGVEVKPLPYLLAITNLMLHGIEVPRQIRRADMLARPLRDYGPSDRVDIIVTNPPFGGVVAAGTDANFPAELRTRETADLFLALIMHLLKSGGSAGIVLPDGSLFGEGVKTRIRAKLLEECNLHTIVRLPQGVFSPYAGVKTNLLFFTKGKPTKEIWYFELPLPEGMKQFTKGRPIRHEDFDIVRKWWNKRTANAPAPLETARARSGLSSLMGWKVSIKEIKDQNYNLDFKNPNGKADLAHKPPAELVREIEEKEAKISTILGEIKKYYK